MSLEKNIINGALRDREREGGTCWNQQWKFCNDIFFTKWGIKWRLIELEESHLN